MSEEEAINKCRKIMRRKTTEDCDAEAINTVLKALDNSNNRWESEVKFHKHQGFGTGAIIGLIVGLIWCILRELL